MTTDSAEAIRERLAELGERRAAHDAEDEELSREIKKALKDARGKVSKTEAADLLRIHRTTLYRVYT
jgi:transcriptional regulator of acetoin/glycerol metabolism